MLAPLAGLLLHRWIIITIVGPMLLFNAAAFLWSLVALYLSQGYAHLDALIVIRHLLITASILVSGIVPALLLSRWPRIRLAGGLGRLALGLAWIVIIQALPLLLATPLSAEECMVRSQGEYDANFCSNLPSKTRSRTGPINWAPH